VATGVFVVAIESESGRAVVAALGNANPAGSATTASKVSHRTVKRVVEFNRGRSFSKAHIAAARIVPCQIPFRRVVMAKLMCVIAALLARSPRSFS